MSYGDLCEVLGDIDSHGKKVLDFNIFTIFEVDNLGLVLKSKDSYLIKLKE